MFRLVCCCHRQETEEIKYWCPHMPVLMYSDQLGNQEFQEFLNLPAQNSNEKLKLKYQQICEFTDRHYFGNK